MVRRIKTGWEGADFDFDAAQSVGCIGAGFLATRSTKKRFNSTDQDCILSREQYLFVIPLILSRFASNTGLVL
jgi:hypothetical protein